MTAFEFDVAEEPEPVMYYYKDAVEVRTERRGERISARNPVEIEQ